MPRKHRGAEEDNDGAEADRHRVTVPVAANVRRLRTARGVTQEALAERVGCATKYLQSVERAEANLSARMLGALARALAVDVARLLEPVADGVLVRVPGRPKVQPSRVAANRAKSKSTPKRKPRT